MTSHSYKSSRKIWGTGRARHVREGPEPSREDAELVVGLAAVLVTYLTRQRATNGGRPPRNADDQ